MTPNVERKELHHRQLDLRFFERPDGLFEVEGRLVDRKTHPFRRLLHDRDTPAGAPLHDIVVRLVITHIKELLGPMATTAHQGLAPRRLARMTQQGNDEHKSKDRQLLCLRESSRRGRASLARPS